MTVRILRGDCREVLTCMPDESVHCVVTSPPYYGLRDYGTARWEGGDPACDHKDLTKHQRPGATSQRADRANVEAQRTDTFRHACGRCGAARVDRQIGLEESPDAFIAEMVTVFREVRRVLRSDGVCWLNLGDSYASAKTPGYKEKDLLMMPARVALALQADGWWIRKDIIWHKINPMPESVSDRCTSAHEHIFHLTKAENYFFDEVAIMEPSSPDSHARAKRGRSTTHKYAEGGPGGQTIASGNSSPGTMMVAAGVNPKAATESAPGAPRSKQNASFSAAVTDLVAMRNKRDVWSVASAPYPGAHFATFPPDLIEPCILAGTSERGCCPTCAAPWERVMGEAVETGDRGAGNGFKREARRSMMDDGVPRGDDTPWVPKVKETIGWRQTCDCPAAEPVPCTVLDPFGGAGTTGMVADRRGRHAVLIELNPDYAAQAVTRINKDGGMFSTVDVRETA